MKKLKKYSESAPTQGQCAHEPAVEYQAMRKELPPHVLESIRISEEQIARGEAIDFETVIEQWKKKVDFE